MHFKCVRVCVHSFLHHDSLKFNGTHRTELASLLCFKSSSTPHHLLPFYKQIFKFPNEDSKISNAKRNNRIFALAQQKIDNNKKVHFTQNKYEEGKTKYTHAHTYIRA